MTLALYTVLILLVMGGFGLILSTVVIKKPELMQKILIPFSIIAFIIIFFVAIYISLGGTF